MIKITTLYKKDPDDLSRVINEIDPQNEWAIKHGIPTRKFDGTACAIIDGKLYKRYDAKINKETGEYKRHIPDGAISCQEPDLITGHHPHWVQCNRNDPADKYHFEGFDWLINREIREDGTYELCGEKVQSNPERINGHELIKHGENVLLITDFSFEWLKQYLSDPLLNIEGIVFHHKTDGRMCKLKKSDFGIKRII